LWLTRRWAPSPRRRGCADRQWSWGPCVVVVVVTAAAAAPAVVVIVAVVELWPLRAFYFVLLPEGGFRLTQQRHNELPFGHMLSRSKPGIAALTEQYRMAGRGGIFVSVCCFCFCFCLCSCSSSPPQQSKAPVFFLRAMRGNFATVGIVYRGYSRGEWRNQLRARLRG